MDLLLLLFIESHLLSLELIKIAKDATTGV